MGGEVRALGEEGRDSGKEERCSVGGEREEDKGIRIKHCRVTRRGKL